MRAFKPARFSAPASCDPRAVAKKLAPNMERILQVLAKRGAAVAVAKAAHVSEATVSRVRKWGRDVTLEELTAFSETSGIPVQEFLLVDDKPFGEAFIPRDQAPQYVADLAKRQFSEPEEPTTTVQRSPRAVLSSDETEPTQSPPEDHRARKVPRRR